MKDLLLPRKKLQKERERSFRATRGGGLNTYRAIHTRRKFRWVLWLFLSGVLFCVLSALPFVLLKYYNPPTSNFIRLNKAAYNHNIKHEWVDMKDISKHFPVAVMASEDQQFPSHYGFDIKQIKLVLDDRENGLKRGASTISQQLVKNLFLWPGKSLVRKGIEAWLTGWMELILTKRRILELYVNFAQFGKSVFGIGAASEHYFGIPPSRLSAFQSALIAAALPTPSSSNPGRPSAYLSRRAAFIVDQMQRLGGKKLLREFRN